jgi:hypothetical protein
MKLCNYFILFCLIFSNVVFSQGSFNSESITVTNGDLTTNIIVQDSSATALVIHEFGKSYVDRNTFDLTTEIKRKVKILTKDGLDRANISVYLYKDGRTKQRVKDISATAYNLEGENINTTVLQEESIFREEYNENYTIVKFIVPNVKVGTVITYSYTETSPYMFKYYPWSFQSDIPKLYSEYNTSIPANYDYNIKLMGSQALDINESKLGPKCLVVNKGNANCINSVYVMKNIPAFTDEKFMTTRDNYLSRIEYELKTFKSFDDGVRNYTKTWDIVDKELKTENSIGRQLNKGNVVKDLLGKDITSIKNKLEKAKAIVNYVKSNFVWNERYNLFKETSIKDLVNERSGNANQINLLLYNLLNENNIEVSPIILSTRENGLPTKIYPVLTDFNYILINAKIDGKNYLLDATDKYLSFGQIPFSCLNQYGRLLDFKNGSTWVDIAPDKSSTKLYKTELNVEPGAFLKGRVETTLKGYPALAQKKKYFVNSSDYVKNIQDKVTNIKILNHEVSTKDIASEEFNESFDIELRPETIGDVVYVNPFLFTFFDENPFKLQERTYPIDFGYKDVYQHSIKINLNNNYEVLELPEEITKQLPNNTGQLVFKVLSEEDAIIIYFKYDFKEAVYNSQYYKYLKYYMSVVLDIEKNTLIVLKEKKQ